MNRLAEIRRLYFQTTARTIERDLKRAVELFKALDEADRARAAVYMDGLSQMRSEWAQARRARRQKAPTPAREARGGRARRHR
jgi:hypothetical protein